MSGSITLGEIHAALKELVDQGAHPGAIEYVLHQQIPYLPSGGVNGDNYLSLELLEASEKERVLLEYRVRTLKQ